MQQAKSDSSIVEDEIGCYLLRPLNRGCESGMFGDIAE